MKIYFHSEDISFSVQQKNKLINWIHQIILEHSRLPGELNCIFCSDEYLLELNRKFLSHDYLTDIITFNDNVDNVINGDIYISIDRVKENATLFSVDFNNELKRVIIHGVLHLLGFSDDSEDLKLKMRKLEDLALQKVKDVIIT